MFPLDILPELKAVLEEQKLYTEKWERLLGKVIPQVFHKRGVPFKDPYYAWHKACAAAGLPRRIPHDFRRTAVRRLERAGVPRTTAKALVGHETDSMYERYAIVNEQDLRDGLEKVAALMKGQAGAKVLPMKRASGDQP